MFLLHPLSTIARLGDTVVLRVHVTGKPFPFIQWTKDGSSLGVGGIGGSTLTLNIRTAADFGVYTYVPKAGAPPPVSRV